MKKIMCTMLVLSLITVASVFAQEKESVKNGISLGSAAVLGNEKAGGLIDFGFGLYEKETFFIRNHITLEMGGLGSKGGYLGIGDNVLIGGYTSITEGFGVRSYGIVGFEFGMFYGENKKIGEGFMLSPKGGSGMEFVFSDSDGSQGSFFIEAIGTCELIVGEGSVGMLNQKYPNFENTYVMLRVGGRHYF